MADAALRLVASTLIGQWVATLPRARFMSVDYTKVGKVQGKGDDKRRRGNERVRLTVLCGFSYENLCIRSAGALAIATPEPSDEYTAADAMAAHAELLESLRRSAVGANSSTTDGTYDPLVVNGEAVQGASVHEETGDVYLHCLVIHRQVLIEAEPLLPVKSKGKTIAKRRLRERLPVGRYAMLRITPEQQPLFSYTESEG